MELLAGAPATPFMPGLAEFGLAGVVIGFLGWLLWKVLQDHKLERADWRSDMVKLSEDQATAQKETADKFVGLHKDMLEQLTSYKGEDR